MGRMLSLAVGSVAGGFARYFLTDWVNRFSGAPYPYGTLTVNAAGSFLIGFLAVCAEHRGWLGAESRILLMTGFCGAFTTFSAVMLETSALARADVWRAGAYLAGSVFLGYLLFHAGSWAARCLPG